MLIKLKVHPDPKETSVKKKADDSYEVWVSAPAESELKKGPEPCLPHAEPKVITEITQVRLEQKPPAQVM